MKIYQRMSFRAKLILQAMLAATTALTLAILVLGVYYLNGAKTAAENELQMDAELIVPYAQAAVVFDLVDALGRRDGQTAARTLHRLLDAGEHPMGLLAMIVRQFRLLIQVKELKAEGANPQTISKTLGIHPFPARKLHNQATYFTGEQLEVVYRHLLDSDVAIKSGELTPEVALDLLVAGLTEGHSAKG